MKSEHLVDPELVPLLAGLTDYPITLETLSVARAALAAMVAARPVADAPTVATETLWIDGAPGAPVKLLSYRPKAADGRLPAILFIHGGGYVFGAPEGNENDNRQLAAALNCAIFAVGYRLAPETPFPGALNDCQTALRWMHDNAEELAIDPARIGVKGDSAGGGLAAALAIVTRDSGGPGLAFQHLIYPMIDDRTCVSPDPHPFAGDYLWTPARNRFGWTSLLGHAPGGADVSPYAAAARVEDMRGLPPTFLAVGALDLFLEENLSYARRLSRAGVPIELHVYPGAFHGFQRQAQSRVAQAAERDSREALRRSLHP